MKNFRNGKLLISASTIRGTDVWNLDDEKVGKVEDVMIDTNLGSIAYVVFAPEEGLLEHQNKRLALPWEVLQFNSGAKEKIVVDVSRERLREAPGFDKDNWPTGPQQEFVDEVFSFYSYQPYYERIP
jgi:sporulation protein YlmC with PRC-barrel domain